MLAFVTGGVDTDYSMATLFMAAAEDDAEILDAIVAIAIGVREDDTPASKMIPSAHSWRTRSMTRSEPKARKA